MMKEITGSNLVILDVECGAKEEVINSLSQRLQQDDRLNDINGYINEVFNRESIYPTAVGFNVAIPHGKCDAVKTTSIAFARLSNAIKWCDEENVNMVFLLAVPSSEAGNKHLELLAALSRKLMHADCREKLQSASTAEEIVSLLNMG